MHFGRSLKVRGTIPFRERFAIDPPKIDRPYSSENNASKSR